MADEQRASKTTTAAPASGTQAGPGHQGYAAGHPSSEGAGLSPCETVKFNALRSAYGHEDREAFYSSWHKLTMFVVSLTGTAAFAAMSVDLPAVNAKWLVFGTTFLGMADLVFDLTGKARAHALLRRQFLDIYADAQSFGADIDSLNVRLHKLYADEEIQHLAVDAVAYNRAMRTMDRPGEHLLVVPTWHRLLRHYVGRMGYDYRRVSELKGGVSATS